MILFTNVRKDNITDLSRSGPANLRSLHPSKVGPVFAYDGTEASSLLSLLHHAQVFTPHLAPDGSVKPEYYTWAKRYWGMQRLNNPTEFKTLPASEFFLWDGEKLDIVGIRTKVYIPQYMNAVRNLKSWLVLKNQYEIRGTLTFFDHDLKPNKTSLAGLISDPTVIFHHGHVLAMMLMYGDKAKFEDVL